MKSNLFALLSAVVGFGSGCLIAYKLLNRRRTAFTSFREIYEDNSVSMDLGVLM